MDIVELKSDHIWLEKMKILPTVKVLLLCCQNKHYSMVTSLQPALNVAPSLKVCFSQMKRN